MSNTTPPPAPGSPEPDPVPTSMPGTPTAPQPPTAPPVGAQDPAPVAPAGPAYAPSSAPPSTAYASAPPSGGSYPLSIISLVAGIVGIVGFWVVFIPFIGGILQLFIPAAAVVLGFLGRRRETAAPKGLWLTGLILGFVGLGIALVSLIAWSVFFAVASSSN